MTNALAQETSPYLLQHADNPVDWMPWSQAALDLAKQQNKPILLSIGYSACHWCHVMAHESFENAETAALMNQHFVNIKVDREERPDIDKIYQTAHQLIAQRPGGWPLTMFLSPGDQLPFFGGTYFPDTPKFGMISFSELLRSIATVYAEEPEKIQTHTESMREALMNLSIQDNSNRGAASLQSLAKFEEQLLSLFDSQHGGFGTAPKFPQAAMLMQAVHRAFSAKAEDPIYQAIDFSLQKIAFGGIQDHLAGGFYRYSVDEKWMIPHFEKMLYDNGQLLAVYGQAFRLTGNPVYRNAVAGIVDWLNAEMLSPEGAYYAALDADSEDVEGKFYVWSIDELKAQIDPEFFPLFACKYGLDQSPNFEGHWHLHAYHSDLAVAEIFGVEEEHVTRGLENSRKRLLTARRQRTRPGLDNKILTAWNALVIQGLAINARLLSNPEYYRMARQCLNALREGAWLDGRLLALSRSSGKALPAYLDDYAHLLMATLECLQYQWHSEDLQFAITLADQLLAHFEDSDHGGFYFTAGDHEQLIQRPKSWQDEAMPSGNAVASLAIYRLGLLLSDSRYTSAAERALQSVADRVNQNSLYAAGFLHLLEDLNNPPELIIVRGEVDGLDEWREQLASSSEPHQMAFCIPTNAEDLPEALAEKQAGRQTTAWLCRGFSCLAPTTDLQALLAEIGSPASTQ